MLLKIILIYGAIVGVCLLMLFSYSGSEDIWTRRVLYIIIAVTAGFGIWRVYAIIQLRNDAEEITLRYQITTDGNQHFPHRKPVYIQTNADGISTVIDDGKRILLDSIRYVGVRHVGVNDKDTFDLIEYIAPNGDTLLYDAYLGTSILPGQFEPHYKEAIYWEFNYSNL